MKDNLCPANLTAAVPLSAAKTVSRNCCFLWLCATFTCHVTSCRSCRSVERVVFGIIGLWKPLTSCTKPSAVSKLSLQNSQGGFKIVHLPCYIDVYGKYSQSGCRYFLETLSGKLLANAKKNVN